MLKLKTLRESKELTQTELANLLGLQQKTYSTYETGTANPSIETLLKLSKFYNVTIDYILGNDTKGMTVYTEEQNQIIKMMVQLNEINLLKLYSYTAGLLSAQG